MNETENKKATEEKEETVVTEEKVEETPELETDEKVTEELEKELKEAKDNYLRLMAEYDNFRKRSAKEKDRIYGDTKSEVYLELLQVLDNFDRAVENADSSEEDFRQGMRMIHQQLLSIFKKDGVEAFGKPGDEFDPNIHNAVMHEEDSEKGENEIADVFQKGYRMGDRIIRHAMVKVVN